MTVTEIETGEGKRGRGGGRERAAECVILMFGPELGRIGAG